MNLLPNIFDKYERNARLYPALLVLLPVVVAVVTTLPTFEQTTVTFVIAACILVPVGYALMQAVRQFGRSIEPRLWQSWGGPPSTRFVMWSDQTFSDEWKAIAHKAVESGLDIRLCTSERESEDKDAAVQLIKDAFAQVKAILNTEKPEGEHRIHNIEYGFARNLLGSCLLGAGLGIASSVWCGYFWLTERDALAGVGCIVSLLFCVGYLLAKVYWLPSVVRLAADRYAEKAWTLFVELRRGGKGGETT